MSTGSKLVGYARCSTDRQDLTAQRDALIAQGVSPDRIYVDHGLTGTDRKRPGLREAMAACHEGSTLDAGGDESANRSRRRACPADARAGELNGNVPAGDGAGLVKRPAGAAPGDATGPLRP